MVQNIKLMKNYLLRLASLLLAGSLIFAGSCSDSDETTPETVVPVYPDTVQATVSAGDTYVLHIEPNTEWVVTVPTEVGAWFWIQDGSQKVYRTGGQAGPFDIEIGVSDVEEFDTNRQCEVKMSMNGETARTIAILTRPALDRSLSVYVVAVDDQGDFEYGAGGDYVYESEPVETIELVWNGSSFLRPVKVVANYDWAMNGYPEWLDPGDVRDGGIVLLGSDATKYPLDGGEGEISFIDTTNQESDPVKVKVTIPACRDLLEVNLAAVLEFDARGYYFINDSWIESGAFGHFLATEGAEVYTFHKENGWYYADPSWLHVAIEDEESAVIYSRRVTVTADANRGTAREAYIFILPAELAAGISDPESEIFTTEGDAIRPEYEAYLFSTVKQAAGSSETVDYGFISPQEGAAAMAEAGAKLEHLSVTDSEVGRMLNQMFGVGDAYQLTYKTIASAYSSALNVDYEDLYTVRAFGEDGTSSVDKDSFEFYLYSSRLTVYMYYEDEAVHENYLVFYDANSEPFAAIYCRFDPAAEIEAGDSGDVTIYFTYEEFAASDGSTIEKVSEDSPLYAKYAEYLEGASIPVYHLTFTQTSATMSGISGLPGNGEFYWVCVGDDWLSIEPGQMATVLMTAKISQEGCILFSDMNGNPKVLLIVSLVLD